MEKKKKKILKCPKCEKPMQSTRNGWYFCEPCDYWTKGDKNE